MPYYPCIDCGKITNTNPRCAECKRIKEKKPATHRTLYTPTYHRIAKHIRETSTHCAICGQPATPNNPIQADHIDTGNPLSPLRPAHRTCNQQRKQRENQ